MYYIIQIRNSMPNFKTEHLKEQIFKVLKKFSIGNYGGGNIPKDIVPPKDFLVESVKKENLDKQYINH